MTWGKGPLKFLISWTSVHKNNVMQNGAVILQVISATGLVRWNFNGTSHGTLHDRGHNYDTQVLRRM